MENEAIEKMKETKDEIKELANTIENLYKDEGKHAREKLPLIKKYAENSESLIKKTNEAITKLKKDLKNSNVKEKEKEEIEKSMQKEKVNLENEQRILNACNKILTELKKHLPEADQNEIVEATKTLSTVMREIDTSIMGLSILEDERNKQESAEIDATDQAKDVTKVLQQMKKVKTLSGAGSSLGKYLSLATGWDGKTHKNAFTRLLGKIFIKVGWNGSKKLTVLATRFASRKMGTATFLGKLSQNIHAACSKGATTLGKYKDVEEGFQNVWKTYRDWCVVELGKNKLEVHGIKQEPDKFPETLRFWGVGNPEQTKIEDLEERYKKWKKEMKSNLQFDWKKANNNKPMLKEDLDMASKTILNAKKNVDTQMTSAFLRGAVKQSKANEKEAQEIKKNE